MAVNDRQPTLMTLETRARRTLERIANGSLATVSPQGRPWNSPLYVAFAENLTFYWCSQKDAVHSQNIAVNPHVALVVFDSSIPDESGGAVYIEGTAQELRDDASIAVALSCLAGRKNERPKTPDEFAAPHARRVYALVPETIWTNVVRKEDGQYSDERVSIRL